MRTRRVCWGAFPLAALAAIVLIGSQAPQSEAQIFGKSREHKEARQSNAIRGELGEKRCRASDVIGMTVRGLSGDEKIGSINDLVLGQDGRVTYVAVSFGGFLGMGDKLFAVPFEAMEFVKSDHDAHARIDVTEETLKQKQGFSQDKWPSEADRSFTNGKLRHQAAASGVSR